MSTGHSLVISTYKQFHLSGYEKIKQMYYFADMKHKQKVLSFHKHDMAIIYINIKHDVIISRSLFCVYFLENIICICMEFC